MLDPSGWQLPFTRRGGDGGTLCSSLHKSERLAAPSLFLSCNSIQGRACGAFVRVTFGEITSRVRAVTQSPGSRREDLASSPSFSDINTHLNTVDCGMSFRLDGLHIPSDANVSGNL